MGKSSAPKAPDPKDTSSAQTSTNIGSAIANNMMGMVNETSPTGSLSYHQTGTKTWNDPYTNKTYKIPTYAKTTSLNPAAQKTFDYNQQAEQNLAKVAQDQSKFLGGYLGDRISADSLPARGELSTTGSIDAVRDKATDALMARMQPSLDRDREALEASLVNRGVNIGSEAYGDAHAVQGQKENDMRMSAILAGGQEAANALGMDLQRASFQDQHRGQALEEMFAFRNQPINEISALLAGSQVMMPQFASYQPAQMPTTDVSGNIWNAYNANLSNWQQQQANQSALWGNIIGAGGKIATAGMA